jgi:hypothetical protein
VLRSGHAVGHAERSNRNAMAAAAKRNVGHWYENREQVIAQYEGNATTLPLPFGVDALLSSFRVIRV